MKSTTYYFNAVLPEDSCFLKYNNQLIWASELRTVRRTYYSIQSTTPYNTPIPRLDDGLDQKQEYQPEPTIIDREKP